MVRVNENFPVSQGPSQHVEIWELKVLWSFQPRSQVVIDEIKDEINEFKLVNDGFHIC